MISLGICFDWYIEIVKLRLQAGGQEAQTARMFDLCYVKHTKTLHHLCPSLLKKYGKLSPTTAKQ